MAATFLKSSIQKFLNTFGYEFRRTNSLGDFTPPVEMTNEDVELVRRVLDNKLSMVSPMGLFTTLAASKYVAENDIAGDFVECGVWRGGNAIIASEVFRRYSQNRKVFLYDTFAGMTRPTNEDLALSDNQPAIFEYTDKNRSTHNEWCFASIHEVKQNFSKHSVLTEKVIFVEGPVEATLNEEGRAIPDEICLLRLDTDWYESTKIELEILYPRLSIGGILIIDDYGFWSGSKKATDEYFSGGPVRPFFHVTGDTGRVAVKTEPN